MPANSILERTAAAFAAKFAGAKRGVSGADYNVVVSGVERQAEQFGGVTFTMTCVVEKYIDLSVAGIDWSTTTSETILHQHVTDAMDAGTSEPTLGGLSEAIRVQAYEPAIRGTSGDVVGFLLTFEIDVAWDYGSSTTQNRVP